MRSFSTMLSSVNQVSSQEETIRKAIVDGGFELSAKLSQLFYKQAQQGGNVLFSPINIYSALALVHLGADNNTRDEIAQVMGLPTGSDKVQQTHETLSQILRAIENTTELKVHGNNGWENVKVHGNNGWENVKSSIINIANGIFVQNGLDLVQSYVSQVQSYYKGQVSNVDFATQSTKATEAVNQFISKNTNGRIPQLFSSPISSDTSALVAACLYFKAAWDEEFSEYATKEENFNTGSGNSFTKMLTQRLDVPYTNLPELQAEAISLLYAGRDTSMYFILPYPSQTLDNVISSLNGPTLQRIFKQSKTTFVDIKIPQLKYKWTNDINNQLNELGIRQLFSDKAQLNNMVSDIALKVSTVTHAAEIEVNEKGTEASAVTVIKMVPMSAVFHPKPIPFYVDRPFVMFIYHHETETILFSGAVHNPNGNTNSFPSH